MMLSLSNPVLQILWRVSPHFEGAGDLAFWLTAEEPISLCLGPPVF